MMSAPDFETDSELVTQKTPEQIERERREYEPSTADTISFNTAYVGAHLIGIAALVGGSLGFVGGVFSVGLVNAAKPALTLAVLFGGFMSLVVVPSFLFVALVSYGVGRLSRFLQ